MHPLSRKQRVWLILLLVFWSFYGLTGRDVWKAEEALALGHLLTSAQGGAFLGGSPSPFYTLLASQFAHWFSPWMSFQDGARLTNGVLVLLAFACTGLAARALWGAGYLAPAILALLGSLGLMLRAHALLPEAALLMGYGLLFYGLAMARIRAGWGAFILAVAFVALGLSRGWLDLAAALLIVLLTLLSPEWRRRSVAQPLVIGVLTGLAIMAALLSFVTIYQGGFPQAWWQATSEFLVPRRMPDSVFNDLAWFAWPVWPLAVWAVWHEHRRLARVETLHPLLAGLLVLTLFAHWPGYTRETGLLPLLIPLSLLAAHGLASLKRGAAQALYWFGVLTFLFFTFMFWGYFSAIEWGWPSQAAAHMVRLTPNYAGNGVSSMALTIALTATLFWLVVIPLFPRAKVRPVLVWATGMILTWVLMMSLFKPWADAGWGYRPLLDDLATHLPARACLRTETGQDMDIMLRYYLPNQYRNQGACQYWLIAGEELISERDGQLWTQVWTGVRPRNKQDVYRLYAINQ